MRCGIISTKEVYRVACEHKRIKSVNCVIFCEDCGAKLDKPPEPATEKKPEKKPVKKPAKKTKAD